MSSRLCRNCRTYFILPISFMLKWILSTQPLQFIFQCDGSHGIIIRKLSKLRKLHPFLKNMTPLSLHAEDDTRFCHLAILQIHSSTMEIHV